MKLLSIGNSFSQDAHRYLHDLAKAGGFPLEAVNLYIGGCSLKRHWENACSGEAVYEYQLNGGPALRTISLEDALCRQDWDIITLQQQSGRSGRPQSFFPYLPKLKDYISARRPDATLWWHQTWAYEQDYDRPNFDPYQRSQAEMFRRISDAAEMAAGVLQCQIIPAGAVIQALREYLPEFDYGKGGLSLNRDGYHLSKTYGRYAAAATWYQALRMGEIQENPFLPEGCDPALIQKIKAIIHEHCKP